MALVRTFPRGPWWAFALGIMALLGSFFAAAWLGSPWPLVGFVVGIIVLAEARGFRCPQCRRRLVKRRVLIDGGPTYRVFVECPRCVSMWELDQVFDPRD